ncbi:non-smc element 4-like protein a [Plakobranchus ocellatus]|uniref:Non-structural maintenance of chromosomes element 4 n=1 Tax=Plakobranchus ocellatus TaxID=259542 RepID=A0AAV4D1J4_9GAST|nr:non-smc element 4-like protein a [Plakobranchus ocellatus]
MTSCVASSVGLRLLCWSDNLRDKTGLVVRTATTGGFIWVLLRKAYANSIGTATPPFPRALPRPFCRALYTVDDKAADKEKDGKTTSLNGRAWSLVYKWLPWSVRMAADRTGTSQKSGLDKLFDSREEKEEVINSIQNKQDEQERRQIRESYRRFQDELSEQAQEVVNPSSERDLLYEKLEKVDKLFKPVRNTREAALDAASLVNLSELGKKKAQGLKTDFLRFNAADFCDKVRIKLSSDVEKRETYGLSHTDWATLGQEVRPYFKSTPVLNFMFGAFEKGQVASKKKRIVREKEVESNSTKSTKPTQLSSFQETDRGELTTVQVEHLLKTLWCHYETNKKQPICFFEFITNPHSFGHTIENIFYASFLIRDGHAKVFLDSEDLPVIEPLEKDTHKSQSQSQTNGKQQVVMTLTPAEWREIVNTYKIEVPLIKPMKQQQQQVLRESNLPNHTVDGHSDAPYEGKGKGKGKAKKG